MGRGKVEMKFIEKQSKRKSVYRRGVSGLKKKAYELSVLCDVPALIISVDSDGKVDTFPQNKEEVCAILNKYNLISNKLPEKRNQISESSTQTQILKKRIELNQLQLDNENMRSAAVDMLVAAVNIDMNDLHPSNNVFSGNITCHDDLHIVTPMATEESVQSNNVWWQPH